MRYYRTQHGSCPFIDFATSIREAAPVEYRKVLAAVEKVRREPSARREPLVKRIDDDVQEVRVYGYRVFFYLRSDLMVILDGVRKKQDKAPDAVKKKMRNYVADYNARCRKDEARWDELLFT